jgi:hypothetical protein
MYFTFIAEAAIPISNVMMQKNPKQTKTISFPWLTNSLPLNNLIVISTTLRTTVQNK